MANWDVFHSERLEIERAVDTVGVLDRIARGELTGDDLIRPAGSSEPWSRIGDRPGLLEAVASAPPTPTPPRAPAPPPRAPAPAPTPALDLDDADTAPPDDGGPVRFDELGDDEEIRFPSEPETPAVSASISGATPSWPSVDFERAIDEAGGPRPEPSSVEVAGVTRHLEDDEDDSHLDAIFADGGREPDPDDDPDGEEYDPLEEDEAVAEFTLSRGRADTVEELDLAAMVDVAFQLVLFFLVTAQTVLYKTLEVPKPNPDASPPAAAAPGRSRTLDDLKEDFILVEVDPAGAIRIDREPCPPDPEALAARLREARERTNRQGLLLSADFATPHRNAVLVYDAANEARLSIAIARPARAEGP